MLASELFGLLIIAFIGLGLVGLSIPLLMGKCAGIVAGYSTMTPEERARWNGPALAKFTGKIVLVIGLVTAPYGVGLFCFDLGWLTWIYLVVVVGLSVFAAVYCNTGERFRK